MRSAAFAYVMAITMCGKIIVIVMHSRYRWVPIESVSEQWRMHWRYQLLFLQLYIRI